MTDLENKVRAATSDTSWGASGSDLMQIAQGTFNREDYALIMSIVWQRLGSSRWRCVYKALEVLRYVIMHGAARCTEEARAASHHIQTLQHFRFVDPKTRHDHGEGVRMRAKLVCDMLADESVLEEEREKSKELRAKLQGGMAVGPGGRHGGLSSDDYAYGYGTSRFGPNSHEGVTSSSTGGMGNFKGYGDDNDGEGIGGYDDEPTGTFAKRAANQAGASAQLSADVPDLLGDADENGNGTHGVDDDDDDFDPRAGSAPLASASQPKRTGVDVDDLFGTLGLEGGDVGQKAPAHLAITDSAHNGIAKDVPRSLLIQDLAQQQYQQQQQLQLYQAPGSVKENGVKQQMQTGLGKANDWASSSASSGTGFGLHWNSGGPESSMEMGQPAGTGAGGVKPAASGMGSNPGAKPFITSKADKDPFSDLVDSAKKTGVL